MAPSAALQSRIRQFESLDKAHPAKNGFVQRQVSNFSRTASQDGQQPAPITSVPYVPRKPKIKSPSPSPPNLGLKTSLIDLRDALVNEPPTLPKRREPSIRSVRSVSSNSNISLRDQTSKVATPPLPARNNSVRAPPSLPSRSLAVEHTYPPVAQLSPASPGRSGHMPTSSTSSFHSISLSTDGSDISTPPILPKTLEPKLSGGDEQDCDKDVADDAFSFETVSSAGVSSPSVSSNNDWEHDFTHTITQHKSASATPPRLPPRKTSSNSSTHSSPSLVAVPSTSSPRLSPSPGPSSTRRPPPPPPARSKLASHSNRTSTTSTVASDQSSIFSSGTVTTSNTTPSTLSPTSRSVPIPLAARKRYDALFITNVKAQSQAEQANLSPKSAASGKGAAPTPRKGWRGLSVDLITNPEENANITDEDAANQKLHSRVVKAIWSKSNLDKGKLRAIWSDCALPSETSLDREAFISGMWQIDEELRKAQVSRSAPPQRSKSHSSRRPPIRNTAPTGDLLL